MQLKREFSRKYLAKQSQKHKGYQWCKVILEVLVQWAEDGRSMGSNGCSPPQGCTFEPHKDGPAALCPSVSPSYGLLHGRVLNVSQEAITRDVPEDKYGGKTLGAESASREPGGKEMSYAARVSLDRTQMQVDEKLVNLSPDMAVTVEIKTDSRRISYLLSPVLRYKQEVLHIRLHDAERQRLRPPSPAAAPRVGISDAGDHRRRLRHRNLARTRCL
jgi:hypothetical protein